MTMIETQLNDLVITAYANVLVKGQDAQVVAPVFRLKQRPEELIFPPFKIIYSHVLGGTCGHFEKLAGMELKGEITRLDAEIETMPNHDLWVDLDLHVHYQPRRQARKALKEIAKGQLEIAETAFKAGCLDDAERACNIVLSAWDRNVEPLILKAMISKCRNDEKGHRVMRLMAKDLLSPDSFDAAVERRLVLLQQCEKPRQRREFSRDKNLLDRKWADVGRPVEVWNENLEKISRMIIS